MAYGQRAASSSLSEVFVFLKVVFHPTLYSWWRIILVIIYYVEPETVASGLAPI